MTTEEKKIGIIGKIVNLENEKLIDQVDELLKDGLVDLKTIITQDRKFEHYEDLVTILWN